MIQEVKFQGLSHSPSDYEAQDGELGTCLNLICEDGALKTIAKPKIVDGTITLPEGANIKIVHKATHNNEIHSHYIIHCENGEPYSWYWTEKGGDGATTQIDIGDFKVNSVCAIGNILCFIGDVSSKYAFWNDNIYTIFDNSMFNYNVSLNNKTLVGSKSHFANVLFEDVWDEIWKPNKQFSNTSGESKNTKSSQIVFNGIDSYINKTLEENSEFVFKYLSFGVVAIRLYDGTYTNISPLFVLAPAFIYNKFIWRDSTKRIATNYNLHAHSITVNMNIPAAISELVSGADVFLSPPQSFLNTEETFHTIQNNYNYLWNSKMAADVYSFAMDFIDSNKIYELIDNLTFYKSISIDKENLGKEVKLKRISETAESLSLATFKKENYGGKVSYCYNNRLHIANVKESIENAFSSYMSDDFNLSKPSSGFGGTSSNINDMLLNNRLSLKEEGNLLKTFSCDAIMEVDLTKNNIENTIYEKCKLQYPISPIISYPSTHAKRIVLYINIEDRYYKKDMSLHQSSTMGMSYFVNIGNHRQSPAVIGSGSNTDESFGKREDAPSTIYPEPEDKTMIIPDDMNIPTFIQSDYHKLLEKIGNDTRYIWDDDNTIDSECLTPISKEEFLIAENKAIYSQKFFLESKSLIKVSEAENPLVFPAKNSVQVGSSVINALSANTRPISEGQFGEAPLYAFTDEGVWVLMTNSEGTYDARQPANREICTNPKGILQIDDAVLFPTDRGIMMQQGRDSICITDQLDGFPFDFTQLYKEEYAKKILSVGKIDEESVKYAQLRKFLDDGVNKADMIYDYYDSRIILFNPAYQYAYVYSLKSKMWGTMENNFTQRVNIYPESYAIDKNGKIVDLYVKNPTEDVPYFLCSRPLGLSSPEVHKTMLSCIARGYFRGSEKGKCGMALFGSNDLFHWFPIKTSVNKYLRGMAGSPYKYFRIALVGSLSPDESISGLSTDFIERWQNKLR